VAPNFTTNGPQPAPVVSIDPVTVFTDTTAHFTGHVTPGGTEPSFAGEWYFRCTPECGINPGQFRYLEMDGKEFPVAMDVTGLEPNTDYQVVLHSFNFGGKEVETAPVSFKTSLAVPAVQTRSATEVKTTSAVLNGKVNPHNSAVTYQFEWGLDKTYGSSAPAPPASLGKEDNFFHVLEQPIAGLQEGTVYHFRLSAKNASSGVTAHGEDHTFRTSPAAACPNEQIRAEVSSLALPECRAYEMVTPIEKSANDAGFPGSNNDAGYSYAAADGNAVMFHTRGAMGHAESGLQIFALSRREADGWSTGGAVPLGTQTNINALTYYPKALIFSPNLDRVVWSATASWLLEIPVSTFGTSAVYRAENNGLNQVEWLTRPQIAEPQPPIGSQTYTPISFGASPDLETVYFWGDQTLMPGDNVRASNGGWGLYEYSGDELKHADTLPGGGLPPGGSAPANANGGRNPESWTSEINRGQVSADGKTLYFITPDPAASGQGPPELYVRRNGESTLVSRNEAGEAAPSGATDSVPPFSHSGQFVFGSPDGTSAIFQSEDALTADAPKDSTVKAYQYDVKANTIKYLPGLGGATVVASSDDGQRFLFEGRGLGVWDHGTIKSISNLGGELTPARATADGSDFVFRARVIPGFNSGFSWQVYRYDLAEEQLSCLSCPPDGVAVSTDATLGPEGDGISANYMISPDAGRVFFDSPDPLIPQDKNSVGDVYEWTPGGLSLISTGQTKVRSLLVASSASGNDVFFSTKQTLDPDDTDGLYDIYDARVDGGFKQKPHVSPCSGVDLCHGAPQEAAKPSGGGSDQFVIPPTPKFTAFPGKVVRGKLMVKVKAPVAATVSASGKGLRSTRHTNAKPGTFKLAIPLKPTAIRALREKHHLGLTVHLRYSPETGTPTTADLTLNVGREG